MGARPLTCWPGWGIQGCPRPAASSTRHVLGKSRVTGAGLRPSSAPATKFDPLRRSPKPPKRPPLPPRASGPQPARPPLLGSRWPIPGQPRSPPPAHEVPVPREALGFGQECPVLVGCRGRGAGLDADRTHSPCLRPSRPFKASSRPSLAPQLPPLPPRPGPQQRERCSRSRPREPRVGATAPREHSAPSPASLLPGCLPAVKPWHWPSCLMNGSTLLSAGH